MRRTGHLIFQKTLTAQSVMLISALKVSMKTVLGPFHPHLENALTEDVFKHNANNPLSPLLILVPSDSLRRRLKICLAAEHRLNLLNVYLLTFHQMYLRLFAESQLGSSSRLADDFVLEETLSHWINTAGVKAAGFLPVAEKAGGCGALWQTLRDLRDGGVDPANLQSALDEGLCDDLDKAKVAPLVDLYEGFLESLRQWDLRDYADFICSVRDCVKSSSFLKRFEKIFYYGFYDLTQVQLDVFHEIVRHYPTTLFFPLMRGHPAWVFAERFYERHLQGLASEEEHIFRPDGDACSPTLFTDEIPSELPQTVNFPRCAIISCSGPRDEILTVAKEILRLNRDEGLQFSEIGVVARTLELHTDWIKELFRDHRIPISSSAEEPLIQSPLAKAVLLFLELAGKDYLRSHLVELVSSPFFNFPTVSPQHSTPLPDVWDLLTRRLGITKGIEEWRRLKRFLERGLELGAGEEENGEVRKVSVASEQVAILWRLFMALHHDVSGLPAEASWSDYVELWRQLLEKYLNLQDVEASGAEFSEQAVRRTILETLTALSNLDAIGSKVSLSKFIQTLRRWLERKSVPIADRNVDGVTVVDAMAARGLRFRTIFIFGLNEGRFPRTIREDAFLRDRTRRVMETVLGYKVNEKLSAFDEEKLLFTLLVEAAAERLYCLYQRSDDTGRALAPSWYLAEIERSFSVMGIEVTKAVIPRGIRDKKDMEPFRSSDFLLPEELAIFLNLQGEDAESLIESFPGTKTLYQPGNQLLNLLEDANGKLSQYDGVIGHLPEYWGELCHRGVAPTALERYARCPFQFFAHNILELQPLERPEEQKVIATSEIGKLIHEILKALFSELLSAGFFSGARPLPEPDVVLQAAAKKVFREYEAENPVGYRIVWELWQEEIFTLLREQMTHDLQELAQSARRPVGLEIELQSKFPNDWPLPAADLPIRGAIDRIDFDETTSHYRVIDYKFTMRNKPSRADNDLRMAAVRGEKLQPPIYLLLANEFARRQMVKPATMEAAFYYLAPRWNEGPFLQRTFSADDLDGFCGESLRETIALLLRGIHDGLYFIHPGDACRSCDVAHVCRKNHLPTSWRTTNDPLTRPHREAVNKNIRKE
jgi:ATP-dependent helicase/nuclease subunit B